MITAYYIRTQQKRVEESTLELKLHKLNLERSNWDFEVDHDKTTIELIHRYNPKRVKARIYYANKDDVTGYAHKHDGYAGNRPVLIGFASLNGLTLERALKKCVEQLQIEGQL